MRKWVEAGTDPKRIICNSSLVKYTRSFSSCCCLVNFINESKNLNRLGIKVYTESGLMRAAGCYFHTVLVMVF